MTLFLILMMFVVGALIILNTAQRHMVTSLPSFAQLQGEMPNGTGGKPGFLTDTFLRNHRDGRFPYEDDCHYLGLRKVPLDHWNEKSQPELACKQHRPSSYACEAANRYSGVPGYLEHRHCDQPHYNPICRFKKLSSTQSQTLVCDTKECGGSPVKVSSINPRQGIVTDWKVVKPFHTDKVRELVQQNVQHGVEFCFIKCGDILQVLVFPPVVKENSNTDPQGRLNFNIIVVDSNSRPHFYRMLPKSVAALRAIVYDESIPATALDFEMFQAISQHTFDNIRPLFSGIVKGDAEFSSDAKKSLNPLGIPVLFGEYQKHGYQTMFQEDICWYDRWGIMVTDLEIRPPPSSSEGFQMRWAEFKEKVSKLHVDKFGLTHFSCEAFRQFDRTNVYDHPDKVCFNGQFFSSYYLDYLAALYRAIQDNVSAKPMISYHHFNTGHVSGTGDRIRNMDSALSEFLIKMAYNPYTVTIVLSDHGHTRTDYSKTFEGRLELFDPMFFMVLPYHAAKLLGQRRVAALVENQGRLFTTADVYRALMSLHDPIKSRSRDSRLSGLFAVLPANRTCTDLPLMPLARCKCEGWDEAVSDNSPKHKWLAEFALGQLNNAIQQQFMKGQNSKKTRGYGNCVRLVGVSYDYALERQFAGNILTSFDLHVDPPGGFTEDEVFKIEVSHPMKPEHGVKMSSYNRESLYSKFRACADKSIDIKLCACTQGGESFTKTQTAMKAFIQRPMFGTKTELQDLKLDCLYLMTRRHSNIAVVYELANICSNKSFEVTLHGKEYNMLMSQELPVTVMVKPRTIHFVISAVRYVMNSSYLDIKFRVEVVE